MYKNALRQSWPPQIHTQVRRAQNLERFKALYGSNPVVYAEIFEDLQMTQIAEAYVDPKLLFVDSFLMALHFLKCYPTENQLSGLFKFCEKTARKWGWFYARKIQALKEEKVSSLLTNWQKALITLDLHHFLADHLARALEQRTSSTQ